MRLLCANWKMNLGIAESSEHCSQLAALSQTLKKSEVWAASSTAALMACGKAVAGSKVRIGAQNAYFQEKGAFTGELSPNVLKEAGASFALVGHSERRKIFNETNQLCADRALGLLKLGITVIFCIGETLEERQASADGTLKVIDSQLEGLLSGLQSLAIGNLDQKLILAYEPVWAIGTGLSANVEQIREVHQGIPKLWAAKSGTACPRILYGGSVSKANAKETFSTPGVAGGLIGGASNTFDSFRTLIEISESI